MPSFSCRELLTEGQVYNKETRTSAEESKACTYAESDATDHMKVLSHFASLRHPPILLKSRADRNFGERHYEA